MAITFLGSGSSASANTTATITVGVTVPVRADVIVMICDDIGGSLIAPTDTGGNTYTVVDNFTQGGVMHIGFYRATLTTQLVNTNTITVAATASVQWCIGAWQLDAVTGFDGTPTTTNGEGRGAGTAVSLNLQNGALANATDYLVAAVAALSATTLTGVTAGWNLDGTVTTGGSTNRMWCFSQTTAATGTFPLSGTLGASVNWEAVVGPYTFVVPTLVKPDYSRFPKTMIRPSVQPRR